MSLYEWLAWAGFYTDKMFPHVTGFWSTPLGMFISFTMFVCAVTNVFYHGIDDNWFDRIWYCFIAVVSLCAFLVGINPETDPKNVVRTLVFLLCAKMVVEIAVRIFKFKKTGKCQKTM